MIHIGSSLFEDLCIENSYKDPTQDQLSTEVEVTTNINNIENIALILDAHGLPDGNIFLLEEGGRKMSEVVKIVLFCFVIETSQILKIRKR